MRIHKFAPLIIAATLLIAGCGQNADTAGLSVSKEETAETSTDKIATESGENSGSKTKMEFAETIHDFGLIRQGDMVSHTFKFKNAGTAPLIINEAKASCGCTVPEYPKGPVAPGEEGEIVVKYNGSGRGEIHKTVNITANTEPSQIVLEIKANVKAMDRSLKGPVNKEE